VQAAGLDGDSDEQLDSNEQEQPSNSSDWEAYFSMYSNPAVHHTRVTDDAYMAAWARAIRALGPQHIQGKVVIDVGSGTGLLSLMCAKVGFRGGARAAGWPACA
jgi:16S rRNA G1207 methylase RsmC